MTALPHRRWPDTLEQLQAEEHAAAEKYRPMVASLSAGELLGLVRAVNEAMAELRAEAGREAAREGVGRPGTRIGR